MPDARSDASAPVRHVVVVGGGIAGLAAAWTLHEEAGRGGPALRVTVLEATGQVGGKLRVSDLAGVAVDEGAESLLLRRPEAVDLARAAGLGADLEDAATTSASVWTRGRMLPLPRATVMGVPSDLRSLAASGLLTGRELSRVPVDSWLPRTRTGDDVSVGRYVAARMGRAVVDRLVEPLLGGVYAGRADDLSLEATLPQLGAARPAGALAAGRGPGQPGRRRRRVAGRRRVRCPPRRGRAAAGRGRPPVRRHGPHRRHRARAAAGPRTAGGSSSGRPARPRRCSPTPWCWPSPRRRPPGCCARTRRQRRPS